MVEEPGVARVDDDHDDDDADEPWYIDVVGEDAWYYDVAGKSFMAEEPGEECGDEEVPTVPYEE